MKHLVSPHETMLRSLSKAITYRITGTVTTAAITYSVTRDLGTALAVGGLEPLVKIIVYYLHERVWQRIDLGLQQPGDKSGTPSTGT